VQRYASRTAMPSPIAVYNNAQAANEKKICTTLAKLISDGLPDAEKKVWHAHPVWFDDGNPLVGYAVRKAGVQLLFWSGRAFEDPELEDEGTFQASHIYFTSVDDIEPRKLAGWLRKAKKMQWDYKNIVKRRGKLEKIGKW